MVSMKSINPDGHRLIHRVFVGIIVARSVDRMLVLTLSTVLMLDVSALGYCFDAIISCRKRELGSNLLFSCVLRLPVMIGGHLAKKACFTSKSVGQIMFVLIGPVLYM